MRRSNFASVLVSFLCFLSICSSARAQETRAAQKKDNGQQQQQQQQQQSPVLLAGGRVSFVPPAGFKLMSKEDVEFKFGRNGAAYVPDVVYSNEPQNVSVAVRFAQGRVAPEQLGEFQKVMEAALEKSIPQLEWLAREQLVLNGVLWIHFSLKAAAIDTGLYNEMYFTPFDDKVLIFNFNSTVGEYEKYREILQQSTQTIFVKSQAK